MSNLEDRLREYSQSGVTPMHMPGHKRNTAFVPPYLSEDITEISGFDNLHDPRGLIKDIGTDAAGIWNADSALLSVNGATALILSAIMAADARGKILIASNCHISVWHALELTDNEFAVINPQTDPKYPFCLQIDPSKVDEMLAADPDIKTVVITSPTYEGVASDIEAITSVAHTHGTAVIVDEAHGAHLGLDPYFPSSSHADVVIKSIHKTLHAPTQTALLLTYGSMIEPELIRHYMDIFETSSPSYILMEGIARVVHDLKTTPGITSAWVTALKECRGELNNMQHLKLFSFHGADPSKITVLTEGVINGNTLAEMLRNRKIEVEASFDTHLIAMTGIGDTGESLTHFAKVLKEIDAELTGTVTEDNASSLPSSPLELAMPIKDAVRAASILTKAEEAEGKISASYCFKYPPGIPVLIPGQRITADRLRLLGISEVKTVCC